MTSSGKLISGQTLSLKFRKLQVLNADCIGLPITLQITARVTWSGWPCIARSHTEISLSLSELLHRGTNLAYKL